MEWKLVYNGMQTRRMERKDELNGTLYNLHLDIELIC